MELTSEAVTITVGELFFSKAFVLLILQVMIGVWCIFIAGLTGLFLPQSSVHSFLCFIQIFALVLFVHT